MSQVLLSVPNFRLLQCFCRMTRWPNRYIRYYKCWAEEQSTAAEEVRERGGKKMTPNLSRVREPPDCCSRSTKGLRKVPAQDTWDSERHSVAAWQGTRWGAAGHAGTAEVTQRTVQGSSNVGFILSAMRNYGGYGEQSGEKAGAVHRTHYIDGEKVKLGRPHGKSFQRLNKRQQTSKDCWNCGGYKLFWWQIHLGLSYFHDREKVGFQGFWHKQLMWMTVTFTKNKLTAERSLSACLFMQGRVI